MDKRRDVFASFAQRRKTNGKDAQPIVEIGAERFLLHHAAKVLVGSRDDSHISVQRAGAAQPLILLILEHSQEFGLKFQGKISNFVQKQRSTMRSLKTSSSLHDGAGECSFFMTEEFAFQQRGGDRCAVQTHEWPCLTWTGIMNRV